MERKGGGARVVWRLLTRLWSEETKQKKGGEKGYKKGGGVETPDASLVRGNQKKQERGRGRQEEKRGRGGGRLSSLTRL